MPIGLTLMPRRLSPWLLLVACIWLYPGGAIGAGEPLVLEGNGPVKVGPYLHYVHDAEDALDAGAVLAMGRAGELNPEHSISPHYGYSDGAVWLYARLEATSGAAGDWLFTLDHTLLREIDVLVLADNAEVAAFRGGHAVPADEWPVSHRVFAFPLTLPPDTGLELVIRIAGGSSLQAPLTAWEYAAFLQHRSTANFWFGATYGLIIALLLYNLLLYLGLRDINYLLYVIYVGSLLLALLVVHGFAFQLIWPRATGWAHVAAPVVGALGHIAVLVFARSFLQLPTRMPRVDRWLIMPLGGALLLVGMLALLGLPRISNQILMPLLLVTVGCLVVVGLLSWRGGLAQARYFMLAWAALLAGISLYSLRALGVVPNVFLTEYGLMLGASAELLLLSFALAHRVRVIQDDRERVQMQAERELSRRAYEDQVTGLPNRRQLQETLHAWIRDAGSDQQCTLLLVEARRFHVLLAGRGYKAGDRILRLLGRRLDRITRELCYAHGGRCVSGRFSGPVFGLILTGLSSAATRHWIDRLAQALREPMESEGREYHFLFEVACGTFPRDAGSAQALVRNVQSALSFNDPDGSGVVWFDESMRDAAARQLGMEEDLREALARRELYLVYQPEVNVSSGEIVGLEALLRWNRGGAVVMPGEFVPVAEAAGLIAGIGRWVLAEAGAQVARWREQGMLDVPVAVNISAVQLSHPDFVRDVSAIMRGAGVKPEDIELEITETAAMSSPDVSVQHLAKLRAAGFSLVIDDFGTGYSSLAYLQRFPVHKLKIDRSFVHGLRATGPESTLARRIVELAHSMGMICVAEGVETRAEFEHLLEIGCELAQGFYFTEPLPPEQIPGMIGQRLPIVPV